MVRGRIQFSAVSCSGVGAKLVYSCNTNAFLNSIPSGSVHRLRTDRKSGHVVLAHLAQRIARSR